MLTEQTMSGQRRATLGEGTATRAATSYHRSRHECPPRCAVPGTGFQNARPVPEGDCARGAEHREFRSEAGG